MRHQVRLVVGDWERGAQGAWRFNVDKTMQIGNVELKENESFNSLVVMVREKFNVEPLYGVDAPVLLTYHYPDLETDPEEYSAPPIEINEDEDVAVFMAVRVDNVWQEMYVTLGGNDVYNYRTQRNIEDGVTAGEQPFPTSGLLSIEDLTARGYMVVYKEILSGICTPEEMRLLEQTSLGNVANDEHLDPTMIIDVESSEGSSDIPLTQAGALITGGNVRVSEEINPTLETGYLLGAKATEMEEIIRDKGKGVMMSDEEVERPFQIGAFANFLLGDYQQAQDNASNMSNDLKGTGSATQLSLALGFDEPVDEDDSALPWMRNLNQDFDEAGGSRVQRKSSIGNAVISQQPSRIEGRVADETTGELLVGKIFESREAFKLHMTLYAIQNKFRFLIKKSEPGKMVLQCRGAACAWRVYAAKLGGSASFEVRTLDNIHTCSVADRWEFRHHANTKFVGDMIKHRYGPTAGVGPRPGAIRDIIRHDHNVPISYWKAWRSRELAINQGVGNAVASYQSLPSYLQMLQTTNPGTVVALETATAPEGAQRFKYLFWAFGASIKGYPFMRKVVIIDGTHLKGKYAGCLLTASAQDGNYHIYPIGFGIVDSENDEAWTWFFRKLSAVIPDSEELVFVSDRHNSIYSGIRRVYPMSHHCACILHLQRNVQTIFKKKHLIYLIGRAARAYKIEDFYVHFNEIKKMDIACADYLIRVGLEHWARAHFEGERYNIMTSNLAESLNAALAEARAYPIVALLEYIRTMMMGWFSGRREAANANTNEVTPRVTAILGRNFQFSTGYNVRHIINEEYEVRDDLGMFNRVDLKRKSCSCKEFDKLRLPCVHALAAALNRAHKVEDLMAHEYSAAYWKKAYEGAINPVGINHVNAVATDSSYLLPPNTRRPPGRPRKSRILSAGEIRQSVRFKRKRTCTRCGGVDHNRATCRMPI